MEKLNWSKYQEDAARTLAILETPMMDQIHMVTGMSTEVGEIQDAYKKNFAYGKPLDETNVKEEIGDLMWYVANLCRMKGWDMNSILDTNIAKLKARFPKKFTQEDAENRNLNAERVILESNNN
mgnify:FL=1|tara:strand:- start:81 stop:452 length:372 start_codon:yes stop_codon:yes gene_type:complete